MTDEPETVIEAGGEPTDMYSPWAGVSLVCVLLSFGGCILSVFFTFALSPSVGLVIFALPLVSLFGVITGVIALFQINRSGGMIGGRMSALTGVIGGLALTALLGSVAVGASIFWFAILNNVVPTVQEFADASAAGDWVAARARLSEETRETVDDAALGSFWSAVEPTGSGGASGDVQFDFGLLGEARRAMRTAADAQSASGIDERMYPVRLVWADGSRSLAYVFADQEALEARSFVMTDAMVMVGEGEVVTLLDGGPADAAAASVGWTILR